jgi:hypothetical protein
VVGVRETKLQKLVHVALTAPGQVFWRNNIGVAEYWNVHQADADVVAYGVGGPGGSDLIGLVGGRFVALELKTPGGRTSAERAASQAQFRALVRAKGGFATVVRSVGEALAAVERAKTGASD